MSGRGRPVAVAVLVTLALGAALAALLPFRASTVVRQSGWSAPPGEVPEPARPVEVSGDCGPPVTAAWPTEQDRVQAVTEGTEVVRYEAEGRLGRSCDAPAARRLALSAALLVPTGILVSLLARRAPGARSDQAAAA